jgi:CRP-like cAMP-binding protein
MENQAKIMKFPQDSIILQEGEVNLDMYKILKGNAELYTGYGTDKELLLGIIGPSSCFGELGLLLHAPSIYTVVAFSDVYAMRVTEGEMGDFVQQNHKNIIEIMRNMANTMMVMQKQIDMMIEELIETGKQNETVIKEAERNVRGYAVYNPKNSFSGKYRYFDYSKKK